MTEAGLQKPPLALAGSNTWTIVKKEQMYKLCSFLSESCLRCYLNNPKLSLVHWRKPEHATGTRI